MITGLLMEYRRFLVSCCALAFVLVGLLACKPDTECRSSVDIGMQVVFALDSVQGDTLLVNFTALDSVTVQGVGNDSILYDNQKAVKSVFLPLKTDANSTAYSIQAYNKYDTLFVSHDNNVTFISLACGCFVYHTITDVSYSGGLIDSLVILNAAIEGFKQDNVRLYFHL